MFGDFWRVFRQRYPTFIGALVGGIGLLLVFLVAAGALFGVVAGSLHYTATEKFCAESCHEMTIAASEHKGTVHDTNRSGVRADCAACHIPKDPVGMIVRKIEASREVWGHLTGKIDTKEKYEKHRAEMAQTEWKRLKKTDSQVFRNCHNEAKFDPEKQSDRAKSRHQKGKAEGKTCIDCHFGIAHKEPEGPGPADIKF